MGEGPAPGPETGLGAGLDRAGLEELITDAPDGVVVVDRAGTVVYANRTLERLFGYGPGELVGRPIELLVPERWRGAHVDHRQGFMSAPGARPMGAGLALIGRRRDGSEFPVDVSLGPSELGDGLVTAFARDVTDRRQAEEAIRTSEEWFRLLVENVVDHALYVVDPHGRVASWNRGAERLKGYTAEEAVGLPFAAFFTAEDRAAGAVGHAIEVARVEGSFSGEGWRVRRDGSRFRAHVSLTRLDGPDGSLRGFAEVTRDVTDAQRLGAVADLSQAILAGTPTAEVLELTGRHATSIVDATVAWVVGRLGRPGRLGVLAAYGEGADDLVGAEVSDRSFAARSMHDAQLITVPSLEDRAVGTDADLARGLGPTLFVALHHSDVVLGVLAVARPPGDQPFRLEEIRSVELFADQAALALHTSSMRAEIDRLELLEERERIARDLHDTVIQRLFATGMTLQSSLGQVGPPEVRARLEQSISDLDDTIRSIRTTIFDLQRAESVDAGSGARDALSAVVAESARSLGFEPSIRFVGPVDAAVGDATLAEMVPTLREALSNIARHAAATAAVVTVAAAEEVELTVTDDGRGMPGGRPAGGQGLDNMAARARRLGGRMRLDDAEPEGTRVVWRVPIGP